MSAVRGLECPIITINSFNVTLDHEHLVSLCGDEGHKESLLLHPLKHKRLSMHGTSPDVEAVVLISG